MAVLRIWDRVLTADEVKRNMLRERPESESGLVGLYIFDNDGVKTAQNGEPVAMDRSSESQGSLSSLAAAAGAGVSSWLLVLGSYAGWVLLFHDKRLVCVAPALTRLRLCAPPPPPRPHPQATRTILSCAATAPSGCTPLHPW